MLNLMKTNIKNSPIYNLSISSLENFYTSFLNWMGQEYPRELLKILTGKEFSKEAKIAFETQVQYGKNIKLDLQIKIKDGDNIEYVVVENKLKSYLDDTQLIEYKRCFYDKNATLILLSYVPKIDLQLNWIYKSYAELADGFRTIFDEKFSYKNEYHKFLITDFISVIENITSKFPKKITNKYDFYKPNDLDEIHLTDIYIKFRTSELANYIKNHIKGKDYRIGHSFHNKKGTIDIVKRSFCNPDYIIGIQIEGKQYRYFINAFCKYEQGHGNRLRKELAQKLMQRGLWFNNTIEPEKSRIYKSFCGYSPDFIYRYFLMDEYFGVENIENVSYKQIMKQINKDVLALDENIITVLKTVQDINMRETNLALEEINIEALEF